MRLLFINQYYWPDLSATAQQLTDLAEYLAGHGHQVEVLCSRNVYDGPTVELQRREAVAGVAITRLKHWGSRQRGIFSRFLAYLGFHVGCAFWLLRNGWRYEAVVTLTDPPLVGIFGALLRRCRRGRVKDVCWMMDVYPDCLFAHGSLRPRSLPGALLEGLSRFELRSADGVVVLGECMRDRVLAKGVAADRVRVIGVWNRADQLRPMPAEHTPLRQANGLADKFVVMYSGNAGRAHTFDAICQAMRTLRDEPSVQFLFVGGGKRLEEVEAFVRQHQLPNFKRLPYFPREQLNESLAVGDVHLVSLCDAMVGVVVPCKLYGIMGAGRPAIFVGPGASTVAREVQQAEAGVVVKSDEPEALASAIRRLAADPAERQRLGENGRRFFLEHHERKVCCRRWEELLERLKAEGRRRDA